MTLVLDDRRRAMLAEMGLRTWGVEVAPPAHAAAPPRADRAVAPGPETVRPAPPPPPSSGFISGPTARQPTTSAPAFQRLPVRPGGAGLPTWDALRGEVVGCTACQLSEGRRNPVPGAGDLKADWLVVGEAPGESEDLVGTPFAGQEGVLLDNMLRALRLDRRHRVYLTHALKCRAPANRSPEPAEVACCEAHLRREVELLQPRVILALGRVAVQALLPGREPLGKLRGRVHEYRGVPVVVSYAPAYLLRNLPEKARAWADLCLAQEVVARQGAGEPR